MYFLVNFQTASLSNIPGVLPGLLPAAALVPKDFENPTLVVRERKPEKSLMIVSVTR